jgi:hypothetical protein
MITSAVPEFTIDYIKCLYEHHLLPYTVTMTTGLPTPPAAPTGLSNGQITEGEPTFP